MSFGNLRAFLDALRQENQLIEVSAQVDPYLEIAEIHRRVIEEEGSALLFTNVKGSPFPVVTNLFGTSRRVDLAFGPKPEQLMKDIIAAKDTMVPPTPKALWNQRQMIFDLLKVGIRSASRSEAPILQVCNRTSPLSELPVITSWQEDGGPFVTLPLVYTEHPDGADHNLGMYRMHVYDGRTTGMHWQIHKAAVSTTTRPRRRTLPCP